MIMQTVRRCLLSSMIALAALSYSGAAGALDSGSTGAKVIVKPLASATTTASGQPIVLPQKNVQVLVSTYEIPSGATLPVHKHPSARYAYVQGGTLQVTNVETGQSKTYQAGDFIIEMIDTWHQAVNLGADPVKLLVIDQVEEGTANTLLRK